MKDIDRIRESLDEKAIEEESKKLAEYEQKLTDEKDAISKAIERYKKEKEQKKD